jgi:superfamily II DNA or RNA helicase
VNTNLIDWPHQTFAHGELVKRISGGDRRILLTSPTGGGKSRIICRLIEWAVDQRWHAVLYTNRRLLIDQLGGVLQGHNITYGIRAAGHRDNRDRQVQISSLPTERTRTLSGRWEIHGKGKKTLAIVDEAHLNSSFTTQAILQQHISDGGVYVGVTATPIGLGHLYESLIVAGTTPELRKCGALVSAYHYGPDEPDMKRFKPNVKTGEYTEDDIKKAIMTKCVFGRVLEHYQRLNTEGRPTILFGPGVKESIWFAEQFTKHGIRAAHIDGDGIWLDGDYRRTKDRDSLLQAVCYGEIKVLCNRFVLREGLDLPEVSHLILATVFGSLQSYLQSCGRGLRKTDGKDRCTIQDHGGHYHRHGSVNADREWTLDLTNPVIAERRLERLRSKREAEPIRCPKCQLIRAAGAVCPQCGYESKRRSRMVVQEDGRLVEHEGDIYKPRRVAIEADTESKWRSMYYRARNSRQRMTFRQAEGLFAVENRYHPPRNLPLMPKDELDWYLPVADVPPARLISK